MGLPSRQAQHICEPTHLFSSWRKLQRAKSKNMPKVEVQLALSFLCLLLSVFLIKFWVILYILKVSLIFSFLCIFYIFAWFQRCPYHTIWQSRELQGYKQHWKWTKGFGRKDSQWSSVWFQSDSREHVKCLHPASKEDKMWFCSHSSDLFQHRCSLCRVVIPL